MKRLGMGVLVGAAVATVMVGAGGSAYAGESGAAVVVPASSSIPDFQEDDFTGCGAGRAHHDEVSVDI